MARIYSAVVQGGVLVGGFDIVNDVDLAADVLALKKHLKIRSEGLAGVELRHMTVFGPWAFNDIPVVKDATEGWGCDPGATLSTLVDGMERAFFIVHITAPPPSAAAGASGNAIAGLRRVRTRLPSSAAPRSLRSRQGTFAMNVQFSHAQSPLPFRSQAATVALLTPR